jgi:nicotinate-nucleotide--dimethylbenzimidazole phosphoribosyltransferase
MTIEQMNACLSTSAAIVQEIEKKGCTVIGFGEMGIANTSSAAVIMSLLCNLPIEKCVGRGTGLDDAALKHKLDVLTTSLAINGISKTPLEVLATYGGFEIAQMVGAILQSAQSSRCLRLAEYLSGNKMRRHPSWRDQGHTRTIETNFFDCGNGNSFSIWEYIGL